MFLITICPIHPALASSDLQEQDITLISDMNETVGKDLISLIDTRTIDIDGDSFYEVFPSPNADKILVKVSIPSYPKSKPNLGGMYGLYMVNPDGSDFRRIACSLTPTNNGGIEIASPEWSASGKYFSYLEFKQNARKSKVSAQMCILDQDLELIQKVTLSLMDPYYNGYWFPADDKRGIFLNDTFIVYDLDKRTHSEINVSEDACLSPDNKKISSTEVYNDMHVLNIMYIESGKTEVIFSSPHFISDVQWSPDSNKIIFTESMEQVDTSNIYAHSKFVIDLCDHNTYSFVVYTTSGIIPIQWYPNSDMLIMTESSNDISVVSSYMISSGEKHELFNDTENPVRVFVTPSKDIIVISKYTHMMVYPHRWHYLIFITGHDHFSIKKVFDWKWKGNDLVYRSDNGLFFLNTTDYKIRHIELPPGTCNTFNIDPQGRYLYAGNSIFKLNEHAGQVVSLDAVADKHSSIEQKEREIEKDPDKIEKGPDIGKISPDKYRMEENTSSETKSDVKAPGFTLCISICALLLVFCIMSHISMKKEK